MHSAPPQRCSALREQLAKAAPPPPPKKNWGYIGTMENEMETTTISGIFRGIMENGMETITILEFYRGYIRSAAGAAALRREQGETC